MYRGISYRLSDFARLPVVGFGVRPMLLAAAERTAPQRTARHPPRNLFFAFTFAFAPTFLPLPG
jgi:hypothetical protein